MKEMLLIAAIIGGAMVVPFAGAGSSPAHCPSPTRLACRANGPTSTPGADPSAAPGTALPPGAAAILVSPAR